MTPELKTAILIKEKEQFSFLIPTKNHLCEFAPDGSGKLIQEFDFSNEDFKAIYVPSDADWAKGIVILKIIDTEADVSTIIEIKLVEYMFPANIVIHNDKYLKFKKYDKFKDVKMDLTFNFDLYYDDEDSSQCILMQRENVKFDSSLAVSILLPDSVLDEIALIKEHKFPLKISLTSDNPTFIPFIQEIEY